MHPRPVRSHPASAQSHILCFYSDTVCAVLLTLLAWRYGPSLSKSAMGPVATAAGGVFGHGLAHLGLWFEAFGQPKESVEWYTQLHPAKRTFQVVFLAGFFFALLRSAPSVGNKAAAIYAFPHGLIGTQFVPTRFQFTYVQTVLLWVAAGHDLLRPAASKDVYYDLSSVLITIPVGLVSWIEALACDGFLVKYGGHVYYDTIIPVSMFVYYYFALRTHSNAPTSKKTE